MPSSSHQLPCVGPALAAGPSVGAVAPNGPARKGGWRQPPLPPWTVDERQLYTCRISRTRSHLCSLLLIFLGVLTSRLTADNSPVTRDPLTPIAPLPSLVAFAAARQIPLKDFSLAPSGTSAAKGDQVVLLLTLEKAGASQQWLARLTADDLTEKERTLKPEPEVVIHTSTGLTLHYPSTHAALRVEFIGPFQAGTSATPPVARQARALVSREYLELGIAGYCESALRIIPRLQAAGIPDPHYYGGDSKPSAEAVAQGKKVAEAFGLTPEEERQAFSVFFGLQAFFTAAMEVPTCRDVLEEVIQKPSIWSVLGRFGVSSNFEYGWQTVRVAPEVKAAGEQPVYLLPVRVALNNTPAVNATLAVTTPRPPLQAGAGIFALCAEHPTAPDRRLFIRMLSARRASDRL